jgi:hypothetical protein
LLTILVIVIVIGSIISTFGYNWERYLGVLCLRIDIITPKLAMSVMREEPP